MTRQQLSNTQAQEYARARGMFCRISERSGMVLVFYTGEEENAGTWLEAGRTALTPAGMVDRGAVYLICG